MLIGNEMTHATLFWLMTGALTFVLGVQGFLFKRMDDMKKEISSTVPTKEEVRQIANSLSAIATRLDSLYTILAAKALEDNRT